MDPKKIEATYNWPLPKTPKSMCGFLSLMGYYCKFVWNCGKIATPLTVLFKKNVFSWACYCAICTLIEGKGK